MRVHYRKSVLDRVNDAIEKAEEERRDIMAIDLSASEWVQFAIDLKNHVPHQDYLTMMAAEKGSCYLHRGVLIQLEKKS